jgi:hypothetical protein
MIARVVLALGLSLLFSWGMALVALAAGAENLIIAGNGPELTTIGPLAHAFEKATPRASLDVVWNGKSKPVDVRRLLIDKVELEVPTVKDGSYPFRRPVLFLSKKEPHPVAEAFTQFVLSQAGEQLIAETYIPIRETYLCAVVIEGGAYADVAIIGAHVTGAHCIHGFTHDRHLRRGTRRDG